MNLENETNAIRKHYSRQSEIDFYKNKSNERYYKANVNKLFNSIAQLNTINNRLKNMTGGIDTTYLNYQRCILLEHYNIIKQLIDNK